MDIDGINDITEEFIDGVLDTSITKNEMLDLLCVENDDDIDWDEVDKQIFLCPGCHWWLSVEEKRDDEYCTDCSDIQNCVFCDNLTDNLDSVCDECIEEKENCS
jgi:hypothetical protein